MSRRTGRILLVLLALAGPALAADDLKEALRALRGARDVADRLAVIPKLGATGNERAAGALATLVASDPDLEVRRQAAHELGKTGAANATALLIERALEGGPLAARDAVAWALARRSDAGPRVLASLAMRGRSRLERGLLTHALGQFSDATTRAALEGLLHDPDASVAEQALLAYCAREDTATTRLAVVGRILLEGRDAARLLAALDAAEQCPDPALAGPLHRLETFLEPGIREAAQHLLQVIAAQPSGKEAPPFGAGAPEEGHRYGTPRAPPPARPPGDVPDRSRHDVVYALDATGSTTSTLEATVERIVREMQLFEEQGLSLRVGVVAYRGGHGTAARRQGLDVLPLTYDLGAARAFLAGLESRGVDDRGAAASIALHLALDQMGWRRGAWRRVRVVADGPCDRPADAELRAGIHYRAERTRTQIAFVLRTRTQVPPEWDAIARAGGTGSVVVWE